MVNASALSCRNRSADTQLHIVRDDAVGLLGVVAVDSMVLGPAAGGCRFWDYQDVADMHGDALRLARGMTFKNAMAGLPLGGGKAVLQVPRKPYDRDRLFEAFGAAVEALQGQYVTAEDVGTTVSDMEAIRRRTSFVAGLEAAGDKAGGDPSPWTALGVFLAMEAAVEVELGARLSDVTVAIQGAGNVGARLCERLTRAGARVIVSDIDRNRCENLADSLGVSIATPDEIAGVEADVFAPCALGGALNERTVGVLRARLVCGGANNQISDDTTMQRLVETGISYVPDYVANAGGIINVSAEYLGEATEQVETRVRRIPDRVRHILDRATTEARSPALVADDLALEILERGREPSS